MLVEPTEILYINFARLEASRLCDPPSVALLAPGWSRRLRPALNNESKSSCCVQYSPGEQPAFTRMDVLYRCFGQTNLWGQYTSGRASSVALTEIWRSRTDGQESTTHREVQIDLLSQHLLGHKLDSGGHPCDCVTRIVYASYNLPDSRDNLPTTALTELLTRSKLSPAFDFFTSTYSGVSCISTISPQVQIYTLSYHPKLAVLWTHDSDDSNAPITNALCFIYPDLKEKLQRLLEHDWRFNTHAMLLPFLCTILLSSEVDFQHQTVKCRVREVEVRTGHHQFKNRKETPAAQELGEILAQLNGHTTKLASLVR